MDISFVGLRGHAQRLREIVQCFQGINIKKIYYNKEIHSKDLNYLTKNIEDLMNSDAIFIASPTHVHLKNLMDLKNFKGYIFLEKPAVNTLDEIEELIAFPKSLKSRIFINFNFQFSSLARILNDQLSSNNIGDILWLDVHTSHGAAFRESWNKSWRLFGGCRLGPIETTGIHFLQFAASKFGCISKVDIKTRSVVGRNNSIDTGFAFVEFSSGIWVRIRNSYATPYQVRFEMMGTDGYLTYDGSRCNVYSPRDSFDDKGMFTTPDILFSEDLAYSVMWQESLKNSISFFLDIVSKNSTFSIEKFDLDVNIMRYLISALN